MGSSATTRRRLFASACLLIAGGLVVGWWPERPASAPNELRIDSLATISGSAHVASEPGITPLDELVQRWRSSEIDTARARLRGAFEALVDCSDPGVFVRTLPPDLRDEPVFQTALLRWVERSPVDAFLWLQDWSERERFSHLYEVAASAWARLDPASALQWALSQPPDEDRGRLLGRLAIGYAEIDPELAAAFANEMLPAGAERRLALQGVAAVWAGRDPAAAATWALSLADASTRHETVTLVLYPWFNQTPDAVDAWVRRLPQAAERDALRTRLAAWQIEKDPAGAGPIVAAISDDDLRAQAAVNLVCHWARDDFDQAGEWALRLPASPLRARLLTELDCIAGEAPDLFR